MNLLTGEAFLSAEEAECTGIGRESVVIAVWMEKVGYKTWDLHRAVAILFLSPPRSSRVFYEVS